MGQRPLGGLQNKRRWTGVKGGKRNINSIYSQSLSCECDCEWRERERERRKGGRRGRERTRLREREMKKEAEKEEFVKSLFLDSGRKATPGAIAALVGARRRRRGSPRSRSASAPPQRPGLDARRELQQHAGVLEGLARGTKALHQARSRLRNAICNR